MTFKQIFDKEYRIKRQYPIDYKQLAKNLLILVMVLISFMMFLAVIGYIIGIDSCPKESLDYCKEAICGEIDEVCPEEFTRMCGLSDECKGCTKCGTLDSGAFWCLGGKE